MYIWIADGCRGPAVDVKGLSGHVNMQAALCGMTHSSPARLCPGFSEARDEDNVLALDRSCDRRIGWVGELDRKMMK